LRGGAKVQLFYLGSGPGRGAQKLQAGFDAGVLLEAVDVYQLAQFLPAIVINQLVENGFQREAMQGIIFLCVVHGIPLKAVLFVGCAVRIMLIFYFIWCAQRTL